MFDVAIVGAGPAGMVAALTVARYGLSVVVIDEQQRPGGQILRQAPKEFTPNSFTPSQGYKWASELLTGFDAEQRIERRFGYTVIGVLREDVEPDILQVVINSAQEGSRVVRARRLLIATGAYDMPVPIPGWTLPGVMTAGGVQTLLKAQGIAPPGPVVLVGAHPILIVLADLLLCAGVHVEEVVLAQKFPGAADMLGSIGAIPGHLGIFTQAARALVRLKRAGTRLCTGTIAVAAHGDGAVSRVELSRIDRDWKRVGDTRTVAASTLVLGYGFLPSTEIARQLDCAMRFDQRGGGWVVVHSDEMQTSVPGVFVAGEPTGVAGADQAYAEGMVAGLGIVTSLGIIIDESELRRAHQKRSHALRFSRIVQRIFGVPWSMLADAAAPATLVCKCEMVTAGQICAMLRESPFMNDVNAVKLVCRSGMGACQGRYCEATVGALVARERSQDMAVGQFFAAHLPLKPVPLEDLTELDSEVFPPADE